jgi:hypothetical protein
VKTIINDWRYNKGKKKLKNIAELLSTVHLVLSYISEESIVGTSSSTSTSTWNHLMTSSDVRLAANPISTECMYVSVVL